MRGRQVRPRHELLASIVIKPRFARFEAGDNRMAGRAEVPGSVFAQRLVATADVTALGAAAQVEPPVIFGEALDAARTGGRNTRIDAFYLFAHAACSSIALRHSLPCAFVRPQR